MTEYDGYTALFMDTGPIVYETVDGIILKFDVATNLRRNRRQTNIVWITLWTAGP